MESPVISDFSLTHDQPDAEGSLNYKIKLQVDNPTESAVELLWHRTVFYDSDGMPVSCSEDSSEDYLSKGEKGHLSFYAGYFNEGLVKFQPDDVSASVFVALCRAEVFEYPMLQISDTPNKNVKQDKTDFPDVVRGAAPSFEAIHSTQSAASGTHSGVGMGCAPAMPCGRILSWIVCSV